MNRSETVCYVKVIQIQNIDYIEGTGTSPRFFASNSSIKQRQIWMFRSV